MINMCFHKNNVVCFIIFDELFFLMELSWFGMLLIVWLN
jgi:hypothetical protein